MLAWNIIFLTINLLIFIAWTFKVREDTYILR